MAWELSDWSPPQTTNTLADLDWQVSDWSSEVSTFTHAAPGAHGPTVGLYAPALARAKGGPMVLGSGFVVSRGEVTPFQQEVVQRDRIDITITSTIDGQDIYTPISSGGAETVQISIQAAIGGGDTLLQGGTFFVAEARGNFVALTIIADTSYDTVTVERLSPGGAVILRGGYNAPLDGGLWSDFDYEAPQGVPLTYRATLMTGGEPPDIQVAFATSGPVDYGGDWLMPVGRVELGTNIIVEKHGIGGLSRDVIRDIVKVVNRPSPTAVSWGRSTFSSQFTFLTLTDAERNRLKQIIDYPTLMFVARPGFGFEEPVFLSVGNVTEFRTTGHGSEQSRRWVLDVQEIARPPAIYQPPPPSVTWGTWEASGDIWGDVPLTATWFDFAGFPA